MRMQFNEAIAGGSRAATLPSGPQSKGKATDKSQDVRDDCVICLCAVTDRAVAVPCNHASFDFVCLANWLEQRSSCPLCNTDVTKVEYDWASPTEFKSYQVRSTKTTPAANSPRSPPPSRARPALTRRDAFRGQVPASTPNPPYPDLTVVRRRTVYRNQLFSLHVGSNRESRHKDFTPSEFANSPVLQSRAKTWIRRELQVFAFLNPDFRNEHVSTSTPRHDRTDADSRSRRASNAEFLLNYLIAILKTVDIKGSSGQAEEMLQEFLGRDNARLFLHELNAFLRSPYTNPTDWDRHVQYLSKSHCERTRDD